jgi:hypothetical protein
VLWLCWRFFSCFFVFIKALGVLPKVPMRSDKLILSHLPVCHDTQTDIQFRLKTITRSWILSDI